jgi:hypothetical protein
MLSHPLTSAQAAQASSKVLYGVLSFKQEPPDGHPFPGDTAPSW